MQPLKPYLEFHDVDLTTGWHSPPGFEPGVEIKILAGTLDHANKRGSQTRLLRMLPGTVTTETIEHDFWEEVYVIKGDYEPYDPKTGEALVSFKDGAGYACRPPHKKHGPFRTKAGAMLFEMQYYADDPATE
jgi:hypothetical protein